MPTVSLRDALSAAIWIGGLVVLALVALHLYNAGKGSQAAKDQPLVTQAVTSEVASRVASGVALGASQSNTTRLTKAEGTRKVAQAAVESLSHVLQQLPPSPPSGTIGPMEATDQMASTGSLAVPDSVADAYLDGLKRLRDSGTSGPQAIHKCPGLPGTWLICS